jgi:hypothetical protein
MKFTSRGIERQLDDDLIIWLWPWVRHEPKAKIYSQNNLCFFENMKQYWLFVGSLSYPSSDGRIALTRNERLQGYTWIDILSTWIHFRYPNESVLVLTNIDVGAKGMSFWLRLPKDKIESLMNDVVVLRCDSASDLKAAIEAVADKFADAYGFIDGRLVHTNTDLFK